MLTFHNTFDNYDDNNDIYSHVLRNISNVDDNHDEYDNGDNDDELESMFDNYVSVTDIISEKHIFLLMSSQLG